MAGPFHDADQPSLNPVLFWQFVGLLLGALISVVLTLALRLSDASALLVGMFCGSGGVYVGMIHEFKVRKRRQEGRDMTARRPGGKCDDR